MVIRECFSLSLLLRLRQKKKKKNLGHFEAVLAGIVCVVVLVVVGGGNNGYYVPNKIYAAALSLQRPVPSAMIASSVNLPNRTDVLIDTVQTLLR